MSRYIRIFLLVGLLVVAISCFPELVLATPTNDNQRFEFIVDFDEPEWSHMSINATISSKVSSFPLSFLKIPCTLMNVYYFKGKPYGGRVEYDMVPSETETVNETSSVTFINKTTAEFNFLGLAEFYPYDSYLLNFTFIFADNGLANDNNTSVEMNFPWWRFYGWKVETAPTEIIHLGDFVEITSTTTITRSFWSIEPLRFILWTMFAVLGVSILISPKDLPSRLSVYVAVLLFSIAFFFQMGTTAPPKVSSLSILEILILDLSLGASVFLMFSVAERVAIYDYETVPEVLGQLLLETAGVVIIAFYIFIHFNDYANFAEYFSWVKMPHLNYELLFPLAFILLCKYIHYGSRYIKERRHTSRIKTLNDFT